MALTREDFQAIADALAPGDLLQFIAYTPDPPDSGDAADPFSAVLQRFVHDAAADACYGRDQAIDGTRQTALVGNLEVLATHLVENALNKADVRLCVLTEDLLPGDINRYFVLYHEGELRDALLSEQYRAGFDAVRLLATFQATSAVACAPACACEEIPYLCECEPANTGTMTGGSTNPEGEPESGGTFCLPLPLPTIPGHSIDVCRNAAGQISVRMSGRLCSGPLADDGDGVCFRFPIPLPLPVPPAEPNDQP